MFEDPDIGSQIQLLALFLDLRRFDKQDAAFPHKSHQTFYVRRVVACD